MYSMQQKKTLRYMYETLEQISYPDSKLPTSTRHALPKNASIWHVQSKEQYNMY